MLSRSLRLTTALAAHTRAFSAVAPAVATVRKPAPSIDGTGLVGEAFQKLSLSKYKGKWLVLAFYPLDFTFVCPTELTALSDRMPEFKKINAEVVGVSVDSQFTHLAWVRTPRNKGGLGPLAYPLLADITKSISRSYGVLVEDPADGLNGIALRGTFIIDPKGTVRSIQVNDEAVGRSVDEILRLIQAFDHADKHGEVCPSDWKPGSKTMKPDPVNSQAYFSQLK